MFVLSKQTFKSNQTSKKPNNEKIHQDYVNYQVSSTIEFDQKGDRNFYVSLEKGNKKQILVVSLYGEVSKFEGLGK